MCKKQHFTIADKIEQLRAQYSRFINDDTREIARYSKDLEAVRKNIVQEEDNSVLVVYQTQYETIEAALRQYKDFLTIDTNIYRIVSIIYNYIVYLKRQTSKIRNRIIAGVKEKELQAAIDGGDRTSVESAVVSIQTHLEKGMRNVAGLNKTAIDGIGLNGVGTDKTKGSLETVAKIKEEVARRQAQDIPMPDMVQQSDEKKNLYEDN